MNLLIFFLMLFNTGEIQSQGELKVVVNNIYPLSGEIFVAFYNNADDYMNIEAAAFRKVVPVEAETETIIFTEVPEGEYAIAIFQDINGNSKLDTRGAGIPEEPFGFSNDARGKIGPPKYKNAKFSFIGDKEITINLVNNAEK